VRMSWCLVLLFDCAHHLMQDWTNVKSQVAAPTNSVIDAKEYGRWKIMLFPVCTIIVQVIFGIYFVDSGIE
jgi:hypothetical protein